MNLEFIKNLIVSLTWMLADIDYRNNQHELNANMGCEQPTRADSPEVKLVREQLASLHKLAELLESIGMKDADGNQVVILSFPNALHPDTFFVKEELPISYKEREFTVRSVCGGHYGFKEAQLPNQND